jgi:hypothetical protein
MSDKDQILEIFLKEYDKLKSEQTQRIGFRDNLLYVTLGLFGTILSFSISKPEYTPSLLIIPWLCLILGWTYLVNDEKISAIGKYIRLTLVEKVKDKTGYQDLAALFGWEIAHRNDNRRKRRKIEQLIIDEITFVLSGLIALIAFWILNPTATTPVLWISIIEALLVMILGIEIILYADLVKGRSASSIEDTAVEEIIMNMLEQQVSLEDIATLTKLPIEQINFLSVKMADKLIISRQQPKP